MCGRFTQTEIAELDREVFRLLDVPASEPRYNIAPTQDAMVIREERDGRRMAPMRWGLIPHWARDPGMAARTINARGETLAKKPAFRDPYERRRCIIPANGFYEWKKTGGRRQPYYIRPRAERVFALAGLWDRWLSHSEGPIESFTIITTLPNELVAELHDRMPAILHPDAFDAWLDPEQHDTSHLPELLRPFPENEMELFAVSTYVNKVTNEGPTCIERVEV